MDSVKEKLMVHSSIICSAYSQITGLAIPGDFGQENIFFGIRCTESWTDNMHILMGSVCIILNSGCSILLLILQGTKLDISFFYIT